MCVHVFREKKFVTMLLTGPGVYTVDIYLKSKGSGALYMLAQLPKFQERNGREQFAMCQHGKWLIEWHSHTIWNLNEFNTHYVSRGSYPASLSASTIFELALFVPALSIPLDFFEPNSTQSWLCLLWFFLFPLGFFSPTSFRVAFVFSRPILSLFCLCDYDS